VPNDTQHDVVPTTTRRLLLAVLVSFVLHVALLILVPKIWPVPVVDKKTALRVWLSEPPKKPYEKKENKLVVESTSVAQQRPKTAQYLAEQDNLANKQIRAKPQALVTHKAQSLTPGLDDQLEFIKQPALDQRPLPKKPLHDDPLGIKPSFNPTHASKAHAAEYLPEVAEGDKTELNTWQWRHAPFFNRIKERIGQIWSPQAQIARFDPQGSLLGQLDRVTVLSVTINREGDLVDLGITNPSGVAYLDEEAERTVKKAAPFSFPPKELFLENNEFSFTFAFHLHVNRGFSFDFDW
jgi:TonB family protein